VSTETGGRSRSHFKTGGKGSGEGLPKLERKAHLSRAKVVPLCGKKKRDSCSKVFGRGEGGSPSRSISGKSIKCRHARRGGGGSLGEGKIGGRFLSEKRRRRTNP